MGQFISQTGMRGTRYNESIMRGVLKRVRKDHPEATLAGAYNCGCSPDCGGFHRIVANGEIISLAKYLDKKVS